MTEAGRETGPGGLGADAARTRPPAAPVRVVMDVRALQEPSRAPRTAAYLEGLLSGFDADPVAGESFAFLLASDEDDPTVHFTHLDVIGRRLLPPTRLLRSAALTIDPFVLRGASVGAAWRADRSGAAGAVYHAASGGLPIASGLPTVVTLLDLAPWELRGAFQRGLAARFGQRLRSQLLRDAAAVLVGTDAVATAAQRHLHLRPNRIHVIPLAPRAAIGLAGGKPRRRAASARAAAERLGLKDRWLVYPGRHDARHDAATLMAALGRLAAAGRPAGLAEGVPWPPKVVVLEATPDDRAAIARVAARHGAGEHVVYAPAGESDAIALTAGARALLLPLRSEATGLAAIDALAAGVPVIAASVGALPEIIGTAGILVEPGDPERLAAAITTAWGDSAARRVIVRAATDRATGTDRPARTWVDVARDVRTVYAAVGRYRR